MRPLQKFIADENPRLQACQATKVAKITDKLPY